MTTNATETSGVYQQRDPKNTPLYKIIVQHFDEFKEVYPDRFEEQYGPWRDCIDNAVKAFLDCGLYERGFTLIDCPGCDHKIAVPFSCELRNFCPSCQQKRAAYWSEWLADEILISEVDHRQLIFTLPKILRCYFRYNHYLLGDLAKCAWLSLKEFFQTLALEGSEKVTPAAIIVMQSFGNLVNYNPHIHAIIANGYFIGDEFFPLDETFSAKAREVLAQLFRSKVIDMLQKKASLSQELARKIPTWRHNSGFSVHAKVLVDAGDREAMEKLGRYTMRNPIAQKRISIGEDGTIYYHTEKINPNFSGNFRFFRDALDFLAEIFQHIPEKGFQMVRYYGRFSNAARGKRNKETDQNGLNVKSPQSLNRLSKSVRRSWARLIKKMYKVDPMICPHCHCQMKVKFVEKEEGVCSTKSSIGIPCQPRGQPIQDNGLCHRGLCDCP